MTCCRSFWLCQRDLTSSSALPHDESRWTFCTSHSHFRHFLRFTRPTLILIFVPFRWPWRHDGHATTAPNRIIVVWDPGALGESSKQFFIQYYNVLYNVLTKATGKRRLTVSPSCAGTSWNAGTKCGDVSTSGTHFSGRKQLRRALNGICAGARPLLENWGVCLSAVLWRGRWSTHLALVKPAKPFVFNFGAMMCDIAWVGLICRVLVLIVYTGL